MAKKRRFRLLYLLAVILLILAALILFIPRLAVRFPSKTEDILMISAVVLCAVYYALNVHRKD